MSLKFRRFLYLFFIFLFFVLSIIVIAYSLGYRYDFKKAKFQRKGGLFLEFQPKEVFIYLNGKLLAETGIFSHTFRTTDLLPGYYALKITKPKHQTWEKLIKVPPQKVNFISGIILPWQKPPTKTILTTGVQKMIFLPFKNVIFLEINKNKEKTWAIYDPSTEKTSFFQGCLPPEKITLLNYLPSFQEKWILAKGEKAAYLFNIPQQKIINLDQKIKISLSPSLFHWSNDTEEALYFLNKNCLYQINLLNYKWKKFYQPPQGEKIKDFAIRYGKIYLLAQKNNKCFLEKTERFSARPQPLLLLPNCQQRLLPSPAPFLALQDSRGLLTLFDLKKKKITLQTRANKIKWDSLLFSSASQLAYSRRFGLSTFNFRSKLDNLITRQSQPLVDFCWYPDKQHLVFIAGKTIYLSDVSARNVKMIYPLFTANGLKKVAVGPQGKYIYWQENNQLRQLELY